jgi:hypothetical protein
MFDCLLPLMTGVDVLPVNAVAAGWNGELLPQAG